MYLFRRSTAASPVLQLLFGIFLIAETQAIPFPLLWGIYGYKEDICTGKDTDERIWTDHDFRSQDCKKLQYDKGKPGVFELDDFDDCRLTFYDEGDDNCKVPTSMSYTAPKDDDTVKCWNWDPTWKYYKVECGQSDSE
ncbi:Uu.00g038570.m01.CDS01 [Anthostomella pinea]|uniref:Uu.00g038570.m01.CDS01 n=1 Tax=Anthostomella pinea TaxID=933095 RepID=A0AAI8V9U4_9PEZI|nr:Uu.00g038570.m01.CDS01 [Anthostomella pinea]